MNRQEAEKLIIFEALNPLGMIEQLASFSFFDFDRASTLLTALEELADLPFSKEINRELAGAILIIMIESSLSYNSWDSETRDKNYYLIELWDSMYETARTVLLPNR